MKTILTLTTAATLMAGSAFAQTTQTSVAGASGDPVYSLRVNASDGVTYNCKPEIETIAGVQVRECVRADRGPGLIAAGEGLTTGAGAAAVGLLVLAVAAGGGGDNSATTTTN